MKTSGLENIPAEMPILIASGTKIPLETRGKVLKSCMMFTSRMA